MTEQPHPSAVLKSRDGLGWWEWRRPEDGVLQIQLTGKGILTDAQTDRLAGDFLDDSSYVLLASDESVDIYKPKLESALDLLGGAHDDPETRLLMSLRKRAFDPELVSPAYKILRLAAGASKNRGYAAGKATPEGFKKDPSRFIVADHTNKDPLFRDLQKKKVSDPGYLVPEPPKGSVTAGYLTGDGYESNTSESNQVYSGIVGNFNWTPRNPYCRQTSFTRDYFERFATAIPLIEAINREFKYVLPGRWANQREFIRANHLPEKGWMIGDTVFSTITVNKNYRTGVHKDAGDYLPGFGNLTVLEGGKHKYLGSKTVFPKFRCAVDLRNGDFLGMDVHEWHGNTAMSAVVEGEDDYERISVVCYVRVEMTKCGTVAEEKAKHAEWFKTYKNPEARHLDLIESTKAKKESASFYSSLLGVVGDIPRDPPDPEPSDPPSTTNLHLEVLQEKDEYSGPCPHHLHSVKDPANCRECPVVGSECFEPSDEVLVKDSVEQQEREKAKIALEKGFDEFQKTARTSLESEEGKELLAKAGETIERYRANPPTPEEDRKASEEWAKAESLVDDWGRPHADGPYEDGPVFIPAPVDPSTNPSVASNAGLRELLRGPSRRFKPRHEEGLSPASKKALAEGLEDGRLGNVSPFDRLGNVSPFDMARLDEEPEMKNKALWIVGEPGVGKTTLVRALVGSEPSKLIDSPKWTLVGDFALAGHYTGGTFDGADTVPYNAVDTTLTYWETELVAKTPVTIFDGDRFSHESARERISRSAVPMVLHLVAPAEVVAARRKERGSNQDPSWLKGRKTKSEKFARTFPAEGTLVLDAKLPTEELRAKVEAWLRGEAVESLAPEPEDSVLDMFS